MPARLPPVQTPKPSFPITLGAIIVWGITIATFVAVALLLVSWVVAHVQR